MKSPLQARKSLSGDFTHRQAVRGSKVAYKAAHMRIWSMFGKKYSKITVWG